MATKKQAAEPIGDRLLTLQEAAAALCLNPRTVRTYVRRGGIHARIIGGRWRFSRADLDDFRRSAALPVRRDVRIKSRKVSFRRIYIPWGDRSYKAIYVTDKQLAHLNRIPVGKEIFLSNFYCLLGGGYWVIRTNNGLRYMPNPYCCSEEDIWILESMLRC